MKKLISTLAAVSMLSSALPFAAVNAEGEGAISQSSDGVIVLEDNTAAEKLNFTTVSGEKYFGGTLVYVNDNKSELVPTLTWNFDVSKANGKFEMWIVTYNETGKNWISRYNYSLNNGEAVRGESSIEYDRYTYDLKDGYYQGTMSYIKAASGISLQSGTNTLTYTLDKRVDPADNRYINAFDRIVLVPYGVHWTPSSEYAINDYQSYLEEVPSDTRERFVPNENGAIILEAEKGTIEDSTIKNANVAFNGKAVYNFNVGSNPAIEWIVNIPETTQYDVWALSLTAPDSGSTGSEMNLMQMFFGEEGEAKTVSRTGGMKRYSASKLMNIGANYTMSWHKVYSNYEFEAGEELMYYNTADIGSNNLFALDRIVIVPTQFYWSPSKVDYITEESDAYLEDDEPYDAGAPFKQGSDGVVWMEAENAASPDYGIVDDVNASGGKYIYIGKQVSDATVRFTTEFVFDIKDADSYDIWVLGVNRPELNWYSAFETSLDNENYKTYRQGYVYGGCDLRYFNSLYSINAVGTNLDGVKWTRANVAAKLEAGRHTFEVEIGVRPDGGRWYISQIDAVAVVPSRLNWVPDSVNAPSGIENGYAWIESENSVGESRFKKIINERYNISDFNRDASNGTFIKFDADDPNAGSVKGNEKLDYKFTLANDGLYDVYFLGTLVDEPYLSNLYYDFDNEEETIVDAENTKKATASEVSGTHMRTDKNVQGTEYWQKIGSGIALSAGDHVLNTEWTEREGTDPDSGAAYANHYLSMDVYAIIPTDWEWSMPGETRIAAYTALDFDTTEKVETLKKKYADGVTENLEGLNTYGSAGCHFTYDAKNPGYISADGTVTQPIAPSQKVSARLEVFAHRINYSTTEDDSQIVRLYVLPDVGYKNFNIKYSDGAAVSAGNLVSGKTVVARADVRKIDEQKENAMLAVAVYKNGLLEDITSNEITLTDSYQPITTSITLPSDADMSVYTLKVFIWDSLQNANPYQEALSY